MTIEPKRLIELLGIAQHGSYTRAAAAQGVSQPALSNSIAALEKSLGVRLLERTRHGSTLTEFGQLLVGHAEALQSLLARASRDVELKKRGMDGSLAVGVSPIACVELVPGAIADLKRELPNVAIAIHEQPDDELMARLLTGEIDVMVSPAGLHDDPPGIEREVLLHDTFIVVMRPTSSWAKYKSLTLRELRNASWIMPNTHTAMWRHIEALFAVSNVPWPISCVSTNSITALKSLVHATDSVSISSRRLMKPELDARYLVGVTLRDPRFSREICLRRRREARLTPLVERFVVLLRETARRMADNDRRTSRRSKP